MKRCLPLIIAALLTACAATPPVTETAPAAPPVAWKYTYMQSYEAKQAGLGVSYRYESTIGWTDAYVYTMRRTNWAAGVADAQFQAHFRSIIEAVEESARRGVYTDLKVGATRDLVISGQNFRSVSFQYKVNGRLVDSLAYLTALDGQLLKYRMSFYAPVPGDVDAIARQFIETNLREGMPRAVVHVPAADRPWVTNAEAR
ncbi:MAG: hypothetical protein ACREUW_14835 [Burkholderiales bacterium]